MDDKIGEYKQKNKKKCFFIWFCLRFILSLPHKLYKSDDNGNKKYYKRRCAETIQKYTRKKRKTSRRDERDII